MISIDRLEEMAIEELETKLNNWKEQVVLQSNFIDSLLKATNNSEWLDKTILDDEAAEIIEKIELDYAQLDQLKAENDDLKRQHEGDKGLITATGKMNYQLLQEYDQLKSDNKHLNDLLNQALKDYDKAVQTLTEIKEIAENGCYDDCGIPLDELSIILQKISECEGNDG